MSYAVLKILFFVPYKVPCQFLTYALTVGCRKLKAQSLLAFRHCYF